MLRQKNIDNLKKWDVFRGEKQAKSYIIQKYQQKREIVK